MVINLIRDKSSSQYYSVSTKVGRARIESDWKKIMHASLDRPIPIVLLTI